MRDVQYVQLDAARSRAVVDALQGHARAVPAENDAVPGRQQARPLPPGDVGEITGEPCVAVLGPNDEFEARALVGVFVEQHRDSNRKDNKKKDQCLWRLSCIHVRRLLTTMMRQT